jgi:hypothetical protein
MAVANGMATRIARLTPIDGHNRHLWRRIILGAGLANSLSMSDIDVLPRPA